MPNRTLAQLNEELNTAINALARVQRGVQALVQAETAPAEPERLTADEWAARYAAPIYNLPDQRPYNASYTLVATVPTPSDLRIATEVPTNDVVAITETEDASATEEGTSTARTSRNRSRSDG
jgi:hypothetical protein